MLHNKVVSAVQAALVEKGVLSTNSFVDGDWGRDTHAAYAYFVHDKPPVIPMEQRHLAPLSAAGLHPAMVELLGGWEVITAIETGAIDEDGPPVFTDPNPAPAADADDANAGPDFGDGPEFEGFAERSSDAGEGVINADPAAVTLNAEGTVEVTTGTPELPVGTESTSGQVVADAPAAEPTADVVGEVTDATDADDSDDEEEEEEEEEDAADAPKEEVKSEATPAPAKKKKKKGNK